MNILDNIKNGKYKTELNHPDYINKRCNACKKRLESFSRYCPYCGSKTDFEKLREQRKSEIRVYRNDEKRLMQLFKDDCLQDFGLSDHPKKADIFDFAWAHGHSAGLHEVYNFLKELSELFK